jgi:uncharacterized damage-inducible protein DinB
VDGKEYTEILKKHTMKKSKTAKTKKVVKPVVKKASAKSKNQAAPKAPAKKEVTVLDKNIYPIGKHAYPAEFTEAVMNKLILEIRVLPEHLKSLTKKLKKKNLQLRYREGGWTVEQLIHHLADSHMNAYIRFKLALTESNPAIKPYDENLWAEMADVQACSIKDSVRIIRGLHSRWNALLENMSADDWKRTFFHPEHKRKVALNEALSQYAWHGKHHVAQIQVALKS